MMLLREESFRTFEDDDYIWLWLILPNLQRNCENQSTKIKKIVRSLTMDKLMNVITIMTLHLVLKESKSEI